LQLVIPGRDGGEGHRMLEWLVAALVPVGVLALCGVGYWIWAAHGTEDPVEHHSSMPSQPDWPDG